ncbi:MAG TPA: T9SS type A sorting domain-containing protein [Bacteroidia bacterium]|jgi:hypothetical protein|nr:T9SS type A sorting domain-containing protein [Bacteroidia bacterium]
MKKFILLVLLFGLKQSIAQNISTIAGNGTSGYSGDGGPATAAMLEDPNGIAVDGSGNIFVADPNNACVRKIDPAGNISSFAGNGTRGNTGDGGPASAALLVNPMGVAVDQAGNVYIADYTDNKIRKVNTSGIITTIAGTGIAGFSGDNGPAGSAQLAHPIAVATDGAGNVYIADNYNYRLRKINAAGIINTIAGHGTPGPGGDGGHGTAGAITPEGIAIDKKGNVYIMEITDVRKLSTSDIITTYAGAGPGTCSGDGGPAGAAIFGSLRGISIDNKNNLLITDGACCSVRRIDTTGIITLIAGNGSLGFSGDGGPAVAASLSRPAQAATDKNGNIYIADGTNYRVRKVSITTGINEQMNSSNVNVYPIPGNGDITTSFKGRGYTAIGIYDMLGREVYSRVLDRNQENISLLIDLKNVAEGMLIMKISTEKGIISKRLEVQH